MDYTKKSYKLILFLLPAFVIYGVFYLIPIGQSIYYSTLKWNGLTANNNAFVFLDNYIALFKDEIFFTALKNTLILACFTVFIQIPFALFFSIIMNHKLIKYQKFYRFIYFLPVIMMGSVVALMWKFMYEPNFGLFNSLLTNLGLEHYTRAWLTDSNTAIYFASIPQTWQFVGLHFAIMCAGLTSIPSELYEASDLDGASFTKQTFYITLPMIKDIIVICLILGTVGTFKAFDHIWLLTRGGPNNSTQLLATYSYREAFEIYKFGYAAAISTMIFVLSVSYTLILKFFTRREIV